MVIHTKRMILRKVTGRDIPDLYELDQDTEVRRYIDGGRPIEPWPEYQERAQRWLESLADFGPDLGFWLAYLANETLIGWFHLRPNQNVFPGEMEIGYRLQRKFWGQGLATEGTQKLLDYAFSERKLSYVMATTLAANLASQRVMEKSGMHLERTFVYPEKLAPYWNDAERAAVKYAITSKQ